MGTTAQKLQKLADTKQDLTDALSAMGRTVPTKFSEYADEFTAAVAAKQNIIEGLVTGSGGDTLTISGTAIAPYALYYHSTFRTVNAPNATSVGGNAFRGANNYLSRLGYFYGPKVTEIGSNAFQACRLLTTVEIPLCETISGNAFASCVVLTILRIPVVSYIGIGAFQSTGLTHLYITGKTIAEVKAMANYANWMLSTTCTIHCSDGNFKYGS